MVGDRFPIHLRDAVRLLVLVKFLQRNADRQMVHRGVRRLRAFGLVIAMHGGDAGGGFGRVREPAECDMIAVAAVEKEMLATPVRQLLARL